MIISKKQADEAWVVLRTYARIIDERWDADELVDVQGRTKTDVTDAYRAACRTVHPDMGGDVERFAAVDRAKHVLMAWLERAGTVSDAPPAHGQPCARCNGLGHVLSQRAFRAMRVQCPTCRGAGELGVEQEKGDNW